MTRTGRGAVVACAAPAVGAGGGQAALGWTGRETGPHGEAVLFPRDGETILGPPSLVFQRVPEGKTVKNRLHLDFSSSTQAADVARLEELGARRGDVGQGAHETVVVLADVEGNEFCVLRGD